MLNRKSTCKLLSLNAHYTVHVGVGLPLLGSSKHNIISYALQIRHACIIMLYIYISMSCKKQFKGWNFAIGECGRQNISTWSLHTVIMCSLPALRPLPV